MEQNGYDVVVVGGGAAGLSAALTLGRVRRRVLVLDTGSPRNRFAEHAHGFLGHDGTPPADLLTRGRQECLAYGVEFLAAAVQAVAETSTGVVVTTDQGDVPARALVVASGHTDVLPDVPGLAERWGRSVLHCPYCHGWEVRDRRLGVLVRTPLSVHQAQLVRQLSEHVTVFTGVPGADPGAVSPEAVARLAARGVHVVETPVEQVTGAGADVRAVRTVDGVEHPVEALFVAALARPHDEFLPPGLPRTDSPFGSAVTVDATGRIGTGRIWAAGNVVNPGANIAMSVGAGSMAGATVNAVLTDEDFDAAQERTDA